MRRDVTLCVARAHGKEKEKKKKESENKRRPGQPETRLRRTTSGRELCGSLAALSSFRFADVRSKLGRMNKGVLSDECACTQAAAYWISMDKHYRIAIMLAHA